MRGVALHVGMAAIRHVRHAKGCTLLADVAGVLPSLTGYGFYFG